MNILEFIFKLLGAFINFEPGRLAELKDKGFAWRNKVFAEVGKDGIKPMWYHKFIKYDNEWWFQIGLAITFLFAFKNMRAWLTDEPSGDDFDDLDDEEDDYGSSNGNDDVYASKMRAKKVDVSYKL
jgi:hypothetical protein